MRIVSNNAPFLGAIAGAGTRLLRAEVAPTDATKRKLLTCFGIIDRGIEAAQMGRVGKRC